MGFKVFLDANFLLDLTLHRAGFSNSSMIIKEGINGTIQLYTTPAILHVVAYYTSQEYKKYHAKQIILTLLTTVTIIDCDHSTTLTALNSSIDDIEDAIQYFTALKFGMDYFVSGDKKLKNCSLPQLPVCTASEFLKNFNTA